MLIIKDFKRWSKARAGRPAGWGSNRSRKTAPLSPKNSDKNKKALYITYINYHMGDTMIRFFYILAKHGINPFSEFDDVTISKMRYRLSEKEKRQLIDILK